MFNVSRLSLFGLRFCCLPRKIFLLGQSGIFSCAQRHSVSQFDNAKVITFRCGSRMCQKEISGFLLERNCLRNYFARSFGHLVICQNRKQKVKIRHYNINIIIYI